MEGSDDLKEWAQWLWTFKEWLRRVETVSPMGQHIETPGSKLGRITLYFLFGAMDVGVTNEDKSKIKWEG